MEKIFVSTIEQGIEQARKILYEKVNRKTVLFLSGGNSPKSLYQALALEKKLTPAAVAIVDERYGKPMHETSNEKMLRRTGLLHYFTSANIPFYPILEEELALAETAESYDAIVRKLLFNIPKSVAIVSIGADGHTAGIAPNREDFTNPLFHNVSLLVSSFNDSSGYFKERVTLTFQALAMIDYFILWVFGEEKRNALEKIFSQGSLEEIPGRFYNKPEITEKTVLITDVRI